MKNGNSKRLSKQENVIYEILDNVKEVFNTIPPKERQNYSSVRVEVREELEWIRVVCIVEAKSHDVYPRERDYSHKKLFKDSYKLKTFKKDRLSVMYSVMYLADQEGYSSWENCDDNSITWVFTKID